MEHNINNKKLIIVTRMRLLQILSVLIVKKKVQFKRAQKEAHNFCSIHKFRVPFSVL